MSCGVQWHGPPPPAPKPGTRVAASCELSAPSSCRRVSIAASRAVGGAFPGQTAAGIGCDPLCAFYCYVSSFLVASHSPDSHLLDFGDTPPLPHPSSAPPCAPALGHPIASRADTGAHLPPPGSWLRGWCHRPPDAQGQEPGPRPHASFTWRSPSLSNPFPHCGQRNHPNVQIRSEPFPASSSSVHGLYSSFLTRLTKSGYLGLADPTASFMAPPSRPPALPPIFLSPLLLGSARPDTSCSSPGSPRPTQSSQHRRMRRCMRSSLPSPRAPGGPHGPSRHTVVRVPLCLLPGCACLSLPPEARRQALRLCVSAWCLFPSTQLSEGSLYFRVSPLVGLSESASSVNLCKTWLQGSDDSQFKIQLARSALTREQDSLVCDQDVSCREQEKPQTLCRAQTSAQSLFPGLAKNGTLFRY